MSENNYSLIILALNMLVVSLHRIISSGDILVLNSEYKNITNIINNLIDNKINPDPEFMSICQDILNVIDKGKRRCEIRQTITNADSEKKQKSTWQIIYQISQVICSNALKTFSTNLLKWGEQFIVSSASEYIAKLKEAKELVQSNNDSRIKLEHEELDDYSKLRNKLIEVSWNLLNRYGISDSYMIPQDGLAVFMKAMNTTDPSARQSLLKHIEEEFSAYAPYWLYRAEASMETGNYENADEYLAKFMAVWKPVLRRDPYMAEAMKYKIESLMRNGVNYRNVEEILGCLSKMIKHTPREDWANLIFAGMVYFSLGRKDEAVEYVNLSLLLEPENLMSRELLERIETEELPPRIDPPMDDDNFWKLCKVGDGAKIEEAINNGANVNAKAKDKYGRTILITVAKHGQAEAIELLLSHNADVDAKDNEGWTALMVASWRGHAEIVEILLKQGADVHAKDNEGWTALMKAAWRGRSEVTKILLKHGADVNAKDNVGWTALMGATREGCKEAVKVLLKYGANIGAQNNNGSTALIEAAGGGRTKIAELLLKHGADINHKDKYGRTALTVAERNHHSEVAQLLRAYGAK